jgi:hypothetical protein
MAKLIRNILNFFKEPAEPAPAYLVDKGEFTPPSPLRESIAARSPAPAAIVTPQAAGRGLSEPRVQMEPSVASEPTTPREPELSA